MICNNNFLVTGRKFGKQLHLVHVGFRKMCYLDFLMKSGMIYVKGLRFTIHRSMKMSVSAGYDKVT